MNKKLLLFLVMFLPFFSIFSSLVFATPQFKDYATSQVNNTVQYRDGPNYGFQINITNVTGGVENFAAIVPANVTFQLGRPSGLYLNYTNRSSGITTFLNNTNGIFWINFTQTQLGPAGMYNITWFANNTVNVWSKTLTTYAFNVSRGDQSITLELNGTRAGTSYTRGQIANITAFSNATIDNLTASFTIFSNFTGANVSLVNISGGVLNSVYNLTDTTSLAFGDYVISANISTTQNYTSAANNSLILTVSGLSDGNSCSASHQCTGGYCVHGYCRSSSTYCGDGYCDSGETCSNCASDCGACPPPPPAPPAISTPVKGTSVVEFTSILPYTEKTVDIEEGETGFTKIQITVKTRVVNVEIRVQKLTAKPADVTEPTVTVYRYLSVTPQNIRDVDMDKAKIKFKVEKSWITANNIDSNLVALNRWLDDKWNKLPTTKLTEDESYVYYEAETPGFSYFMVTGEEITPPTTTTTTTTTTLPPTTTTIPPIVIPEEYIPWIVVVLIIVVILVILLLKGTKKKK